MVFCYQTPGKIHWISLSYAKLVNMIYVSFSIHIIRDIVVFYFLREAWDRKRKSHERIKGNRDLIALGAADSTLKLSIEKINNNRIISHQMLFPEFSADLFIALLGIWIYLLDIRFFTTSVEIFIENVKNWVDALLGIMLAVTWELAEILAKEFF